MVSVTGDNAVITLTGAFGQCQMIFYDPTVDQKKDDAKRQFNDIDCYDVWIPSSQFVAVLNVVKSCNPVYFTYDSQGKVRISTQKRPPGQ